MTDASSGGFLHLFFEGKYSAHPQEKKQKVLSDHWSPSRLLHPEPRNHPVLAIPLLPTMEGILPLRLALSNLRPLHALHRDADRGMPSPDPPTSSPIPILTHPLTHSLTTTYLYLYKFIWGPLSLITALLTARNRPSGAEQATRHIVQCIVCVGHLYGVLLYYGTNYFAEHMRGISYSRPETLYYWVYYVGMNAPWAVVPSCEFFFLSSFPSVELLEYLGGGSGDWQGLVLQGFGLT